MKYCVEAFIHHEETQLFHDGSPYDTETNSLVCRWSGFYMIGTFVIKEFNMDYWGKNLIYFKCFKVLIYLKKKVVHFRYGKQKKTRSVFQKLMKSAVWIYDATNRRNNFFYFSTSSLGSYISLRRKSMYSFLSFSSPYFPIFRLNTEIYSVNLPIHSKCGKNTDQKNRMWALLKQCISL